MAWCSA